MEKYYEKLTMHWKDTANLVLGLWLAISPWVLFYEAEVMPAWNAHVVGVVIAVTAAAALISFHRWKESINIVLAVWLIMSPFLLGFGKLVNATLNQLVIGILVGILATSATLHVLDSRGRTVKQ
jgi:hypothetical protein